MSYSSIQSSSPVGLEVKTSDYVIYARNFRVLVGGGITAKQVKTRLPVSRTADRENTKRTSNEEV